MTSTDHGGTVISSGVEPASKANHDFVVTPLSRPDHDLSRGTVLSGRYKLLEQVGEGGMGSVYLAEQSEPVVRRVAVKVIKQGPNTAHAHVRFQQERQVLALMNHSNIARVYDGGVTPHGNPFFVMEFVKGVPLTAYCQTHDLSVTSRLALYLSVCRAVTHAHQKGIIHRDLKPSNIMVSEEGSEPVVKVIDFGVSKAINGPLVDGTIFTEAGSIVGTLEYMAPEQAGADYHDVDTRADVYSLGAILYELLAGTPPFSRDELRKTSLDEAVRLIRQIEPPRPSQRVVKADEPGRRGKADAANALRKACEDLDWVVMKCLEKDRTRRYGSVVELQADVERFLEHKPLSARPPTLRYRMSKLIARHRGGFYTSLAVAAGLVACAILLAVGYSRTLEAERAARSENEIHRTLLRFINNDLFVAFSVEDRVHLGLAGDKDLRVRTLLDRATQQLDRGFYSDKPKVDAALRLTIGKAYNSLGMSLLAEKYVRHAVELRNHQYGAQHPETLESQFALGEVNLALGNYAEAIATLRTALLSWEATQEKASELTEDARFHLCSAYLGSGDVVTAEKELQGFLKQLVQTHPEDHAQVLRTKNMLATTLHRQQRYEEAAGLFREVIQTGRVKYGETNPDLLLTMNNYAQMLSEQKKYPEAAEINQVLLKNAEKVYEADSAILALYRNNVALMHIRNKDYPQAARLLELAVPVFVKSVGAEHEKTAIMRSNAAFVHARQGKPQQAVQDYLELKPVFIKLFGMKSPRTENVLAELLSAQVAVHDLEGALVSLGSYCEVLMAQEKAPDARTTRLLKGMSELAKRQGNQARYLQVCDEQAKKCPPESALRRILLNEKK